MDLYLSLILFMLVVRKVSRSVVCVVHRVLLGRDRMTLLVGATSESESVLATVVLRVRSLQA